MTEIAGDNSPSGRIFLTLQKGGRMHCLALSPAFFFFLVAIAGLVLAGSLVQIALLAMRDIPLPAVVDKEPHAASLRISRLQTEVERLTSRDLMTSDLLGKRLRELAERQAELEAQAMTLERFGAGSPSTEPPKTDDPAEPPPVRLKKLDGAMNELGQRQTGALAALTWRKTSESLQIEAALGVAGLKPALLAHSAQRGVGGPFIEAPARSAFAFEQSKAESVLARHAQLVAALEAAPLRAPLAGPFETNSGFGSRIDPFTRRAGWHSGIDLQSENGGDVLATAGGVVTFAGWNGAYGLMIEIDHGNGLTTRYGHLSKTLEPQGKRVPPGSVIGRTGSTGRSTGPHLHYEVRVDGEPVDPTRYLRAGEMIANLLDTRTRPRDVAYLTGK